MPSNKKQVTLRRRTRRGVEYLSLRWKMNGKFREQGLGRASDWTPQSAERARAEQEARLLLGIETSSEPETASLTARLLLRTYIDEWITGTAKYISDERRRAVRMMAVFGDVPLEELATHHLALHLKTWASRQVSQGTGTYKRNTLYEDLATLRRAWRRANGERLTLLPPPRLPPKKTLPDDSRPKRRLREEELLRLVKTARQHPFGVRHQDHGIESLFDTLGWSGWRPGALYELRIEDTERLLVPSRQDQLLYCRADKGGVGRGWRPCTETAKQAVLRRVAEIRSLPDKLETAIAVVSKSRRPQLERRLERARKQQAPDSRLWVRSEGGRVDGSTMSRWISQYSEAAEVKDVQAYDLRRHACMQILRASDWDCEVARRFSGHRSAQTLLRYVYAPERAAEETAQRIGWSEKALKALQSEDGDL